MQTTSSDTTQSVSAVIPRNQKANPSERRTTESGKAAVATPEQPGPQEDIVTLSSSPKGPPSARKASQPVSSKEKKALLTSNTPKGGFSVYG